MQKHPRSCGAREIPTEYKAGGVRFFSKKITKKFKCDLNII
jgi:hypothetical protein